MQEDLTTLSTDSVQRFLDDATHAMVPEDEAAAGQSSRVILDVVSAVRTNTPINSQDG